MMRLSIPAFLSRLRTISMTARFVDENTFFMVCPFYRELPCAGSDQVLYPDSSSHRKQPWKHHFVGCA